MVLFFVELTVFQSTQRAAQDMVYRELWARKEIPFTALLSTQALGRGRSLVPKLSYTYTSGIDVPPVPGAQTPTCSCSWQGSTAPQSSILCTSLPRSDPNPQAEPSLPSLRPGPSHCRTAAQAGSNVTARTVKEHPIPGAAPVEITVQEQGQHTHCWLRQLLTCCELLFMYICNVSLNSCNNICKRGIHSNVFLPIC